MTHADNAFNAALAQMVGLGKELLMEQVFSYSKLNQIEDRDERYALEKLYYNEIAATANIIRLFTGREISFQWQKGADGDPKHGFALYEIATDAPCEEIPAGVSSTTYSRYSGKQEPDRRVRWGESKKAGKIVKLYELIYDVDANPRYVGGYQAESLKD